MSLAARELALQEANRQARQAARGDDEETASEGSGFSDVSGDEALSVIHCPEP